MRVTNGPGYFAHSAPKREQWEPLPVHLERVTAKASEYGAAFGVAEEAGAAGLLHDLGKASELFTRRLDGAERGLDHWSLGAWAALQQFGANGVALALVIQGHHIGLQQGNPASLRVLDPRHLAESHPLGLRLTTADWAGALAYLGGHRLSLPALDSSLAPVAGQSTPIPWMLAVRLLFSTLVDADFRETALHFARVENRSSPENVRPGLEADLALKLVQAESSRLEATARAARVAPSVLQIRSGLLESCLDAATSDPGVFTLTAPTGSGKTLAMLAFALRHAAVHELRRLIVAVPYLSILEQTAATYRVLFEEVLGPGYMIEHHSLSDSEIRGGDSEDEAHRAAREAAETWDAPLVLTTTVQLLESLFANRPARCRKLHRIPASVILLDEAQTLPTKLALPTLAALGALTTRFRCSVVFATATQPAFDHLDADVSTLGTQGWRPREIVSDVRGLFRRATRVRVKWQIEEPMGWEQLAAQLVGQRQGLAIVNLKRHARELAEAVRRQSSEGLFLLSTNLCPGHRESVLAEVRSRLESDRVCRLVATQCVEAGVDVDFPAVFRALAPLDSIAQAAGRCNRNGTLPLCGEMVVFLPEEERYPPGGYQQAAQVTRGLLRDLGVLAVDLDDPDLYRTYWRRLYTTTGLHQRWSETLGPPLAGLDFKGTADTYRIIDAATANVLVPWDQEAFDSLRLRLEAQGRLSRAWVLAARHHSVAIYRAEAQGALMLEPVPLGRRGDGTAYAEDWFILGDSHAYDPVLFGLQRGDGVWIA